MNSSSGRARFNISRIAIAFPRSTVVFWISVSVAGAFAFRTLRYSLLPDITFPIVVVNATGPMTDAAATADQLSRPIETRVNGLANMHEVRASIYPGRVAVTLSFDVGTNLDASARQVEARLKTLPLPAGAKWEVLALNLNQTSVASYAMSASDKSLPELATLARAEVIPALKKVPGVLEVELLGEPLGNVAGAEARQAPTIVRRSGQPVLGLDVVKRSDANALAVAEQLKSAVDSLHARLPGVRMVLARTQAEYIREATRSTVEALLIAVALSILVIFPFLWSWPASIISALAIPTSLLGTALVMALFGFELDTITLLALALIIGIIIDDAIVDVENIARHLEEGSASPRDAALDATQEIGLTVAAATFTIVAVFLPVGLMGGTVGQFFKPFGVTVSAAVLISLLVARTLSPMLAVFWLKPTPARGAGAIWSAFSGRYRQALDWSLRHRWKVIGFAIASLVGGIAMVPLIPKGLMPRLDRDEFKIVFQAIPGADPFAASLAAAGTLEDFARAFPDVEDLYTVVGSPDGDTGRGVIYVGLRRTRALHTAVIQDRLRRGLPKIDGVTTSVEDIPFVELGDGKPIDFALVGNDRAALGAAAAEFATRLRATPGFVDVATSARGDGEVRHIDHVHLLEAAYITANLSEELSLGQATDKLSAIAREILPAGISLQLGGDSENVGRVFQAFAVTLLLSVACIFAVLFLLFRNWVDPAVIILSLPLAVVGAVFALLVVRSEFGMISLLGIVFLFGLVNKNAILLVDYANQLRATGLSSVEAILRAGPVRLRPILMTTLATILGMMPVAIGLGVGSELRAPMAIAIIGGLITSTLLSLIVVPVVYVLLDRWRRRSAGSVIR